METHDLHITPAAARAMLDEPRQYLGASEIGMCPRKAQYRLRWARAWHNLESSEYKRVRAGEDIPGLLAPDAPSKETLGKFKMGEYLEPFIVELLEAGGFKLLHTGKHQLEAHAGRMFGHPDGLIDQSPGGKWDGWVLEIKTTHPFSFAKVAKGMPRSGKAPEGPQEYHKDQVTVYCVATESPGALFVYYDRGTGEPKLIPYVVEPGRFTKLSQKAAMILNMQEVPPMQPVAEWECKSCAFKRQCAKDG